MQNRLVRRAILTWVFFIPVAIANGVIRETVYKPYIGDLPAHQISTVIACAAFLLLAYYMLRKKFASMGTPSLFSIGLLWLSMTILFEFGFGHYIDGISWERLFADYNICQGRIWGVFLLVIFTAPYIVKRMQKN